ncbi:hypothetical protein NDR87_17590 [Nocardia sp. CDC159]|uniref:Uncharacterized protein n=1 Tax=Nocardia pulmonis TaxID=2951408 RepID=A0A9X2E911_9NOCA|nr:MULTISPECIES: hypothetical protein [Nocardia]MCM6775850.1 hypothetical protein [Nocardia pulmonis]MCM6788174.1 hypothetical protein [Nocardia sp. CDC159]
MAFERGVIVGHLLLPRGWPVLAAVVLGIIVFLALLVLLLVNGSDFHEQSSVPRGSCYPFCTASPEPPPPGWQ